MAELTEAAIEKGYELARERYAEFGVDTEKALGVLSAVPISVHVWHGDDVGGFERPDASLSGGGILVTGAHPGRARTLDELRADLHQAFSLIPGRHRVNLHAMYGDFAGTFVERDRIAPEHFRSWVQWAKEEGLKLDFNATCFSHPKADSGFTLSHKEGAIRAFWIEHVKRCREISAFMGRELGSPCIHDLWIPDGTKDTPVDRWSHRRLLSDALDEIYATEYGPAEMKDALESKLFGIGSESFVVGSHDFYLGYALLHGKMICLDTGHFHPTESIADKLSAILQFSQEVLLHVSRGVRWDSDHVPILNDEIRSLMAEIVRGDALARVHLALDFFDASMNRVGAWAVGARAVLQGLLIALLEPQEKLRQIEDSGDNFARLAMFEELKALPFGAVWDYHCLRCEVPTGSAWLGEVARYETEVTAKRD
ncbi:MAG: L-rhamnose isomerase [Armatimonadota bacterium]|nr:MAG: L-rhamnose isomerase [Armatimonadota bacterium]